MIGRGARQNWDASAVKRRSSCAGAKAEAAIEAGWALWRARFAESAIRILKSCAAIHNFEGNSATNSWAMSWAVADARDKDWIGRRVVGKKKSISRALAWGFAILANGRCAAIAAGNSKRTARGAVCWEFWVMTAHCRILGAAGRESAPRAQRHPR